MYVCISLQVWNLTTRSCVPDNVVIPVSQINTLEQITSTCIILISELFMSEMELIRLITEGKNDYLLQLDAHTNNCMRNFKLRNLTVVTAQNVYNQQFKIKTPAHNYMK